ncbi:MAG TPA: hypothetical protein VGP79_03675, partial [Bryobacteraceae bacterium]|nr:hypothetical protein [Bryobacteraceae bacterium]
FTPNVAGPWEYLLSSNLPRFEGQLGKFTAVESELPGHVRVANVHHFATENNKQHLWMATPIDRFLAIPRAEFDALVTQRASEKFTHLRVTLEAGADLREAAERMRAINARGLVVDLVLAAIPEDRNQRERYVTEIVSRFAPFNLTWMGLPNFDMVPRGRAILQEVGTLIRKLDPYRHPMTTLATGSSAAVLGDKWANLIAYGTPDANVGAVEHQLFQLPAINTGIQSVRDLWNATMNGQYPASGSGRYMTVWAEFMGGNRYWELEPHFDVDGGRALALEGVEYIVYVEKFAPVEVGVEQHGYDVAWINANTGERIRAKDFKGERFTGSPPDQNGPWILHVSREGRKESMLRSYKFDSREHGIPVQEIEQDPTKIPFDIAEPKEGELSLSKPATFSLKVKRASRATRSLLVEWTAEVVIDGEGYRVVGSGSQGTFQIPASIVHRFPGVLSLRAAILNANGKAYVIDKVYRLVP